MVDVGFGDGQRWGGRGRGGELEPSLSRSPCNCSCSLHIMLSAFAVTAPCFVKGLGFGPLNVNPKS